MRRLRRAGICCLMVLALTACASQTGVKTATQASGPGSEEGTTLVVPARLLTGVRTAMTRVPQQPFGVVTDPHAGFAFVARRSSVAVMRRRATGLSLARSIPLPGGGAGETLTPDSKYLLVASARGAAVISVALAENGSPNPVIGMLTAPLATPTAIETAVTPDGRFAFVSIEYPGSIAVFNLARALRNGFSPADYVGAVPAAGAAVGMAVSPDGRWLYGTRQTTRTAPAAGPGLISVISVGKAERDPAQSVVATAAAGYQPVRVVLSANGSTAWVTARASNALLGFSTARLRTHSGHALVADVRVGQSPVGLVLVNDGTRIVVANSNRFQIAGATASLYVVSVPAALAGRSAVLGRLPAGGFPREMALTPDAQTLLITNYTSGQLETVNLAQLP